MEPKSFTSLDVVIRYFFAYDVSVVDDRKLNVLFFGACIIAAVRLAREEIRNTPRVMSRVGEAVELARMIQRYLDRDRPRST